MSRNIAISDDVYRKLKREKGDRSFSEVIEETLQTQGRLADITGQEIFGPETQDAVTDEVTRLSDGTLDRLNDDAP